MLATRTRNDLEQFTIPMPKIKEPEKPSKRRNIFAVVAGVLVALLCVGIGAGTEYYGRTYLYHTTAKKVSVKWPHGVPIGITLSGFQAFIMSPDVVTTMKHQAHAARYSWHANTLRLQVLQDRMVGARGDRYARYYMNDVRQVTDYALKIGLTVVLNAQTELSTGYALSEPLPTHATMRFWDHMMHYYKNNMHVVFDVFNEPRLCSWDEWAAAHQFLINHIRKEGARNQIWVEGRWWGSTLEGVPILKGKNIVYTFHHPGAPWPNQAPVSTETWDKSFGYLADQGIRVVDGEFTNFTGSYDWADPYIPGYHTPGILVRKYLAYLTSHHIGMLAWSLLPGALNKTQKYNSTSREPQGAGQLIHNWFVKTAKENRRAA